MTLPGPMTRGSPRRMYSEATAAPTLRPTMPTAPIVTAAPVWRSKIPMIPMIPMIPRLVENLGFGESLLELTKVPLLQSTVTSVLHQTRITRLEKLTYCIL